jgi:GxxExxY protein
MQNNSEVIYPELSYKIVGILFEVYNQLGPGHREKVYENAIMNELKRGNLKCKQQVYHQVIFKEKLIGKYFFDILIEDKIVVEIKQGNKFSKNNIDQIFSYLKAKNLKLGIIA